MPENMMYQWQTWRNALTDLENVSVPRCYYPKEFGTMVHSEIHSFSDASKDGIVVAPYLCQVNNSGDVSILFLFGQARMAQSTMIPWLKLSRAVLSSQARKMLLKELNISIHQVLHYTDFKVMFGFQMIVTDFMWFDVIPLDTQDSEVRSHTIYITKIKIVPWLGSQRFNCFPNFTLLWQVIVNHKPRRMW